MMKNNSMTRMLSVIGIFVLIAAMALSVTGCGSKASPAPQPTATETTPHPTASESVQETKAEDLVTFQVLVVDLDGQEIALEIITDKKIVGEALLEQGIIAGDMGEYGLYIHSVLDTPADWDKDMTYWAFYINGEYAMTGVDSTEIDPSDVYSFVLTKG